METTLQLKGPKGELTRAFSADIKMNIEGNEVTFTRPNDSKEMKQFMEQLVPTSTTWL